MESKIEWEVSQGAETARFASLVEALAFALATLGPDKLPEADIRISRIETRVYRLGVI